MNHKDLANVLFMKINKVDGVEVCTDFSSARGRVVAEIRDKSGITAITLETKPPEEKEDKNGRYENFIFNRSILRFKRGYRNLVGMQVNLTRHSANWAFRGKSYRINSKGTAIKKI